MTWYEITASKNGKPIPVFYLDEKSLSMIPDKFMAASVATQILTEKVSDIVKVNVRVVR